MAIHGPGMGKYGPYWDAREYADANWLPYVPSGGCSGYIDEVGEIVARKIDGNHASYTALAVAMMEEDEDDYRMLIDIIGYLD